VRSENFTVNNARYSFRKEKFILRVKAMVAYATETTLCRSKITGNYFGDMQIKDCGICDNCLNKKSAAISKEEFEDIYLRIKQALANSALEAKELILELDAIKRKKAWKVIETLQAENKIAIDQEGLIRLT
jgi:ATP-dependent DNA helicase RecQ